MGFHWGGGPVRITGEVAVPEDGMISESEVVAYDIVFRSSITQKELSLHIPVEGCFHDPFRTLTVSDVKRLGEGIAHALNEALHDEVDKAPVDGLGSRAVQETNRIE